MRKGLCYLLAAMLLFGSVDMTAFATQTIGKVGSVSENEVYYDSVSENVVEEILAETDIFEIEDEIAEDYSVNEESIIQTTGTVGGNCGAEGDNLTWSLNLDTGVLTISGSGRMVNGTVFTWHGYKDQIVKLELPSGLTSIGRAAFNDCSGLTGELELPSSLMNIGDYAFSGCSGLTGELKLPSGLTSIGRAAFQNCEGLTGVELPSGLTSIGDWAFNGCRGLTGELELPSGLTSIGEYVFSNCRGLTGDLELPSGLTSIGECAFYMCIGLEGNKVYMYADISHIGENAFVGYYYYTTNMYEPLNITIVCPKGSYAESWAKENGFKVELMDITIDKKVKCVDQDSAGIVVVDKATQEIIPNATVSNGFEEYSGGEVVEIPMTNDEEQRALIISAEGYHSVAKKVELKKGQITYISLINSSNSNVAINAVTGVYKAKMYDLMSEKLNMAYIPNIAEQEDIVEGEVAICVEAIGDIKRYELVQNTYVIATSTDGNFSLDVIASAGDVTYVSPVTTDLVNGKPIYVRIIDNEDNRFEEEIGIKVSKNYISTETEVQKGEFSLGKSLTVKVPDDVPFLGGGTFKVGLEDKKLPIEVKIEGDGTVRIALNKKPDMDINEYKKKYKELEKQAAKNSKKIFNQIKGATSSFGAGFFDADGKVCGYGEGNLSELDEGNITIEVGILAEIEGEGGYKHYWVVGVIPVNLFVEGKATGSSDVKGEVEFENGKLKDFDLTGGTIKAKVEVEAGGGVGVGIEINASVKGSVNYTTKPARDYQKFWLDASGKVVGVVGWLEKPLWESKKYSKVLYETGKEKNSLSLSNDANVTLAELADEPVSAGFTQLSRGYLAYQTDDTGSDSMQMSVTGTPDMEKIVIKNAVYPSADAKLITVGNKHYLFWMEDIITRSSNNRAAIVYSVSTDGNVWSAPTQLVAEETNATPDLGYDICTDGTKIYVVWQDGTRVLSDDEDVVAVVESMGIRTAVLDTADNSVVVNELLTQTPAYYMYPRMLVQGDNTYTAYVKNNLESQDIIGNNTHTLWYSINQQAPVEFTLPENCQIINMELGFFDGICYAICEADMDGDIATDADREIVAVSLADGTITELTDNDVSDTGVQVSDSGNIYWISENNIYVKNGLTGESSQVTTDGQIGDIVFTVVSDSNGLDKILFEKADMENNCLAVYGITEDAKGQYGSIARLTDAEGGIYSKLSATYSGSDLLITGLEGDFLEDGTLLKNLCIYKPEDCTDLLAGVVTYDETQVTAGEALPLSVSVLNEGNTVIQNVTIDVDGEAVGSFSELSLQPGEERELTVENFIVPDNLTDLTEYSMEISVDGERTPADNQTTFKVGYPDINVDTSVRFVEGHNWLDIVVNNSSNFATDGTLKIYKESLEGEVIAETELTDITKGISQCYTISLEDYDSACVNYYVEVVSDGEENSIGDNEEYVYIGYGTGIDSTVSENKEAEVTALYLDKESLSLEKGETVQLTVTTAPATELPGTEFLWTSSNPRVVSVDENGMITAIAAGSAVIGVHYAEFSAECEVTVAADSLEPITILVDSQGGARLEPLTGIIPGSTIVLPELETDGDKVFLGWYTAPTGGTLVNDNYLFYKTMTIYARWQEAQDDLWAVDLPAETYTGKAIKPKPMVYDKTTRLVEGKDYTLSYKRNTKVNDATNPATAPTVTIKGKGNYTGTVTTTFAIEPKSLEDSDITIENLVVAASSKVQKPVPTVLRDGKKLKNKTDFVVEYPDTVEGAYKAPGTYNVVVKAKANGGYVGERSITLTILPDTSVQMSKVSISKITAQNYVEGVPATPALIVKYKGEPLTAGVDYSVEYVDNDKAGTAKAVLTGLSGSKYTFVGTRTVTFKIKGTAISKAAATYEKSFVYDGTEHKPEVTLTTNKGTNTLRYKTDYDVEYLNNVKAGKATIVIKGLGGYTGTVKKTFTITAYDVNKELISVADRDAITASYEKTGAKPTVTVYYNNQELQLGTDYTISYKDNKKVSARNAGKAPQILIKGKGNFKGTLPVAFEITPKNISDVTNPITVTATDVVINAKGNYQAKVTVTDSAGKKLALNKDYQIESYEYNDGLGTPLPDSADLTVGTELKVRIKGLNSYTGTAEAIYKVAQKDISKLSIKISSQVYTGKEITFTEEDFGTKIKVTGKMGEVLPVYGTDYIITGYTKNVDKGKATVTFKGISETWGGSKTVTFQITQKKLKWFWDMLF